MKSLCLALLPLVSVVSASWSKNLNYRSPSQHHPELGVSIHRVVKRNDPNCAYEASSLNFTHGVASGDPYPESVILWTRVAPANTTSLSNVTVSGISPLYDPDNEKYVSVSKSPICVEYKVAEDSSLSNVVDSGTVYTSSDVDFSVKVEAKKLKPFSTYYYQFNVCNSDNKSVIGRTKTSPREDDDVTNIGLAVYSCANYPNGFFNAYGNPDSVDYIIFLGDYIYEYANGFYGNGTSMGRASVPDKTLYTLYDYRARIAQYRTDLDLYANHQQFPWIPVWDDHEVADNTYRDGSSFLSNTETSFMSDGGVSVDQRKMNAVRAYYEWMPIRQVDMDDNLRIWRSFSLGKLVDLIMLDTRHYDRSITDLYTNTDYVYKISNDGGRSMMGSAQEHWFYNSLSSSAARGATWRVVGSQTVFSRVNMTALGGNAGVPFDVDAWDGYMSNKNRTLNHLYQNNINNNIFMSGDSHASWVTDLVWLDHEDYDPETGAGSIGVEFAGTAITSPGPLPQADLAACNNASDYLQKDNAELQWQDVYYRGYYELHISKEQVEANFFGMPDIMTRNSYEIPVANFTVMNGQNRLQRPFAGGVVGSGSLKYGKMVQTNITHDTAQSTWVVTNGDKIVS